MKTAHIIVNGKVQGVGFRWFVQSEAANRGLTGTVRNLTDGTVEIWVDGNDDEVDDLMKRLVTGNGYCKVTDSKVNWSRSENKWSDFRILT